MGGHQRSHRLEAETSRELRSQGVCELALYLMHWEMKDLAPLKYKHRESKLKTAVSFLMKDTLILDHDVGDTRHSDVKC
jgi:hypothetical protein